MKARALAASLFVVVPLLLLGQSDSALGHVTGGDDIDAVDAAREFRIGVQAFNRFAFNEAILSFERALSFRPGEAIILDWLGRAYYRSGFEGIALQQWRASAEAYGRGAEMGMIVAGRAETVSSRRNFLPIADDDIRYVQSGQFPGRAGDQVLYRHPTSVLPVGDGSSWVVAFGSNELVRVGVDGVVLERRRGPLQGFDRPYDIARGPDGRLYVSEFRGGRVSVLHPDGRWQAHIGSRGIGEGQFVGPQNLAFDEEGYLYVVDFGNMRVSKFDPDGLFILSFGTRGPDFHGFRAPTGIAALDGRVFVSDVVSGRIYSFDYNGDYLGVLAEGLNSPESLRATSDGRILAADGNRVLLVDPNTAIARELGSAGGPSARVISADVDANGNLLAANFDAGYVPLLTRIDDMAAGLFVQVERINADRFPLVTVDVRVEDRLRRPIVGLGSLNFVLTEEGRPVSAQVFHIPAYRSDRADVSVLFERSPETLALRDTLAIAISDIESGLGTSGNILSVVSAGEQPGREPSLNALEASARGNAADFTDAWRFDLGLRLAATDLLMGEQKRSVVYVGTGRMGDLAFEHYTLAELAAYMANNSIIFNAVIVGDEAPSPELRFLADETGGTILPLFRPQGIGEMLESVALSPSGLYTLSFRSELYSDFGRAWLPVEAEVYLMERSGRDVSGYFPPLE
ncbi:MAG: NHL repeat-containing protein [Treponema sp.]|nr:NHL repeat-containing protein [Treponema sp.]